MLHLMRNSSFKFGDVYYPGSHRYVYYKDKQPFYYFSDEPYTREIAEKAKDNKFVLGLFIIIVSIITLIFMVMWSVHIPSKVSTDYDTKIVINDYVNYPWLKPQA